MSHVTVYSTDEGHENTAVIVQLDKDAPIDGSHFTALLAGSNPGNRTAWQILQPRHLSCACCSRRYTSQSRSSPDYHRRNDGSRRYFRQFALDTASEEELEMMLQEETQRIEDLEVLVRDMQNSTDDQAATLLAKLRTGTPVTELIGQHGKSIST